MDYNMDFTSSPSVLAMELLQSCAKPSIQGVFHEFQD